jgi:DNA repair exonuclease SbcCD nuclease subunit
MNNYIISDIHFSKTKVLKSISDPMDEFISILRADDEDKRVIISGDYFDQHFDNSDLAYKVAAQYLKNICDLALETIILYGTKSHDRSNYEPILPFLNENVHFFDKVGAFTSKIDNTKFLLIPEEYPEDFSDYYSDHIMADENAYDVVIGHGNIVGAKMNEYVKSDNNKRGGRAFNKEDLGKIAKEVFFGHIHLRQNLLDNVQ